MPTEVNLRRLRPSRPNNALTKEATVTAISQTVYEVTLKPFDCGNQFPLFEISNGRVSRKEIQLFQNVARTNLTVL